MGFFLIGDENAQGRLVEHWTGIFFKTWERNFLLFCACLQLPLCLIATGEAIPLRGLEGVPGLPGAPQDEAGLTRMC